MKHQAKFLCFHAGVRYFLDIGFHQSLVFEDANIKLMLILAHCGDVLYVSGRESQVCFPRFTFNVDNVSF